MVIDIYAATVEGSFQWVALLILNRIKLKKSLIGETTLFLDDV